MKPFSLFLMIILLISIVRCNDLTSKTEPILIDANFDRGSIGVLKQVAPGEFKGQTMHFIKKNQNGNQCYWFYFSLINGNNKRVSIELTNLEGIYRGNQHLVYTDYTQPVISYDKNTWQRITEVDYDETERRFSFSFTPTEDTAWVAYAHPYSYQRLNNLLDTLRNNSLVNVEKIGESVDGRPMQMINIARSNRNTKNVLITAMQHAGEDAGGFMMEGLIQFLLSGAAEADSLLDKVAFHLVPMMNPDGIFYGTSRYNWNMEDLNSDWDDGWEDTTDMTTEPEVNAVKMWTQRFLKEQSLDLMIDIHNHTQFHLYNVYIFPNNGLDDFVQINQEFWDVRSHNSGGFSGSVVWYMDTRYNIPATTLELTQGHSGDGKYLNISDYHEYGKALAKALNKYF